MKKILWLDDRRDPMQSDSSGNYQYEKFDLIDPKIKDRYIVWVHDYEQFCDEIMVNGLPDLVCFDHDLGDHNPEMTGYDAAKWLVKYCDIHDKELPLYAIQSANPVGAENIRCYLENYKKSKSEL